MRHPPITTYFSVGIERLLVRAALEPYFCTQLLEHRDELLASGDLGLTTSEVRLLRSISTAQLAQTVDRSTTLQPTRRGFIRAVPATLAAALAVPHLAGCVDAPQEGSIPLDVGTHDGNRPDVLSCTTTEAGGDYWIQLGGHTSFLHLPNQYYPHMPLPLCIAFHDAKQSCLDMVQAWRDVTDSLNVALVALEWSGEPEDASSFAEQLTPLADELASQYCVQPTYTLATGLGTGATVALDAALFCCDWIHYAIAQTGATPQPCNPLWLLEPELRHLHLTVRTDDPNYDRTKRDVLTLRRAGVSVDLVERANGVHLPVLDPETLWIQLING